MKPRDCPSPPPVHVHVPGATPVYVHVRSSETPQKRTKEAQMNGFGGRSKVRSPWIPPGRSSHRRDTGSPAVQGNRTLHQSGHWPGGEEDKISVQSVPRVSKNLSILLREEEDLRRLKRSDLSQHGEADVLLRALVEAEIDGVTVANQLTSLKDAVDGLVKDKRLSKLNRASLRRQQELLLEKIEMFDLTNQNLRDLLRVWSQKEGDSLVWFEQRDALKKRLDDSEADNIRLSAKLCNKEKEASELAEDLAFEKDNVRTTKEQWRILDSIRDHLEFQLNRTEAEKTRLSAQVQRMQQDQVQKQEELQALQEELRVERQRRDDDQEETQWRRDHEAVTLLTQQAERVEEATRELAGQLQEKETQLAHAVSESNDWCKRHSKEAAAKRQLEEDVSALRLHVTELNSQLHSAEERSRAERDKLQEQLHHLSAENASTKMDNQRLQAESVSSEEKLREHQAEARQLKTSIRKNENMSEKYKKKLQQARMESEEYCLKLEVMQKEMQEVKATLEEEKDQVRRELLGRLHELEALPHRLSRAEQQLRDAQQEADAHELRKMEHSSALSEVRHKVEQQGVQLEMFQQRNLLLHEENSDLKEKIHNLERRLEVIKEENKEMAHARSSKEAGVRSVQQQLEEKTHECSVLSRQLQQSLDDAHRQVNDGMQKVLAKESLSQSKSLDLQSQLSRAKAELSQLQRSKEEMERRFQNQLHSIKDRLEQSDSTNRTLQNYVHFLKTSYGNVFGDSLLTA